MTIKINANVAPVLSPFDIVRFRAVVLDLDAKVVHVGVSEGESVHPLLFTRVQFLTRREVKIVSIPRARIDTVELAARNTALYRLAAHGTSMIAPDPATELISNTVASELRSLGSDESVLPVLSVGVIMSKGAFITRLVENTAFVALVRKPDGEDMSFWNSVYAVTGRSAVSVQSASDEAFAEVVRSVVQVSNALVTAFS